MRKHVISAALLACTGLGGCQVFTAGEPVSEPDPVKVRAAQGQAQAGQKHDQHGHAPGEHHGGHGDQAAKQNAPEGQAAESATASHILIRYAGAMRTGPEITRSKEEAKKLAEDIATKAKAPGADFAELANQFTEDPSGKTSGGKLGTFTRGRMVPEFEKATFGLEPGGVSDVVETAFGFHVIHREK